MAIDDKDIKKLWGLSAGRCSFPGCGDECLRFIDSADPTIIGEMAHIIARKPAGPRGVDNGGEDDYENLILLCPTHHRLIDKTPEGPYPIQMLRQWKRDHETQVQRALIGPVFKDLPSLCARVKILLIENHQLWKTFGPESEVARTNPTGNAADLWLLRKLDKIVPNNRRIIGLVTTNSGLFSPKDYESCCRFIEHAEGFEANCYRPIESVPGSHWILRR